MSQHLDRVREVDPNDSEAVKDALTAFFLNLSKHKQSHCGQWLRALEFVINRFPKYCGQHRALIEIYLVHFLDSYDYYIVIEAAKCAHALQQVRPPQVKAASAKSCWRELMSSLCDAAHKLIDALFHKSSNIYNAQQKHNEAVSTLVLLQTLEDIDNATEHDVGNRSAVLCIRLRNVLVFIQAMLVEIYPVAKPIRPRIILEVILRALNVSANEDSSTVTTVKVQALKTLDALVACLGSNLIPFSPLVFRFIMQTLRWSSEHRSIESRKVRCTAYNSLTSWLNTLRVHREASEARAHSWDTELTAHIINDVTPHKHVMELTVNAQPMKNLSKKARKKLANTMLQQSNISSHMPGEKNKISVSEDSNDELVIAALECAETFLTSCGIFLKLTTHKQLQELLVRECYNITGYSCERGLCLVRALEASRASCSPKVAPPSQYCLQLYSELVNSSHTQIAKFCSQALLNMRLHLHCSPPSLNFAIEEQPQKKKEQKRKRISDRNRSVLESLLGKERMPSEDLADEDEEEVISIPDEPTNKKARTEEDTDKISLSSDSVASIEISDDSCVEESIHQEIDVVIEQAERIDNEIDEVIEKDTDIEDIQETESNSHSLPTVDVEPDNETEKNSQDNENVTENDSQNNESDVNDTEIVLTQKTNTKVDNIFEATTQMPLRVSNDIVDGENSPISMEVVYDYPNTGQEKVTVLEKMDDENLPSTNDTDDVQITCGQLIRSSQDDSEKLKDPSDVKDSEEIPKENGVDKSPKPVENGVDNTEPEDESVSSKIALKDNEVTVEDMLADFVDEVNDDGKSQASN